MPDGSIRMFCLPALPVAAAMPSPIPPPPHATHTPSPPHTHTFRLGDLAYELQEIILGFAAELPTADLCAAASVSHGWRERFVPLLYSSLPVSKANRERVFAGLGLDYLTPTELESRASEASGGCAAYTSSGPNRKAVALAHVRRLTVADSAAATSLAEALMAHGDLLPNVEDLHLGPQLFRHLVNSMASFGRPRSGSAFVGETLVARLKPRRLLIDFPPSRGQAGSFDPVLLARVTALLLTEWAPDSVDYYGVGANFPPALGPLSRIHYTTLCTPFDDVWEEEGEEEEGVAAGGGCRAHALVRMHLRRTFGQHARSELLEAIAEAADPTDDDDIDPDLVPDPTSARVEYYGVPCIATADRDAFLDKTFAHWPVEVDVAAQVAFFP